MTSSPPRIRSGLIERQRLLHPLRSWRNCRLIRIIAPAGFGKSTLAAQWLHELAQTPDSPPDSPPPHTLWISLEPEHDSAPALAAGLIAAFASVVAIPPSVDRDAEQVLRSALHAVAAQPHSVIVVLDNLHVVRSADARAVVQTLLDRSPPNLLPVILSRAPLALDVSRLLASGDILSLGRDDLRFDHAEFAAFAQRSRLAAADPQFVADIEAHAAGWAVGLRLLAQALPSSRQPTLDALLHAAHTDLSSFIDREVLHEISADLSAFLMNVSFLPLLCADLCAAVTESSPAASAQLLGRAAERSGLVTPIHDESANTEQRFRINPLLRAVLQHKLRQQRDADLVRAMRQRAVNWLAAHNMVEASLDALLAIEPSNAVHEQRSTFEIDGEFVADMVHALQPTSLGLDEPSPFLRWLALVPESVLRARPRLVLDEAWAIFYFAAPRTPPHAERMRAMLAGAELRRDPLLAAWRSEAALIDGIAAIAVGRFDRARQHFEAVDAAAIPADSISAGYLHILRAFVAPTSVDSLEHRLAELYRAKEIFLRIGTLRGWIAAAYAESWVRRACGDTATVLRNFELAYESYRQRHLQHSLHNIVTHLLHADMLYYLDRITEARELLLRGLAIVDSVPARRSHRYHFVLRLEMCERAFGNIGGGGENSDTAADDEQWRACFDASVPFVTSSTAYLRVQRDTRLGRPDRVRQSFAAMRIIDSDPVADLPLVFRVSLLTHKVFASRSYEPVAAMLADSHADCVEQGWMMFAMQTRVLQLVHSLRQPDADARLASDAAALDELLAQIEATGMQRYVLNYPELEPLLRRSRAPIAALLVERLRVAVAVGAATPFGLSSREVHILRRLADGLTTDELAADLTISVATARTHLRNIYAKMNVHQRSEAIGAARTAGILDAA